MTKALRVSSAADVVIFFRRKGFCASMSSVAAKPGAVILTLTAEAYSGALMLQVQRSHGV